MSDTAYNSLTSETEDVAVKTLTEQTVPSSPSLSEDTMNDVFTVLSNPEQRYVLTYLLRSDGEITIIDLIDYALSRIHVSESEEFRRRLTVELTQTHLPELDDAGFIEYNMERQLIRASKLTSIVEPYLKLALEQQAALSEQTEE